MVPKLEKMRNDDQQFVFSYGFFLFNELLNTCTVAEVTVKLKWNMSHATVLIVRLFSITYV